MVSCTDYSYNSTTGLEFSLYCDMNTPGVGDIIQGGTIGADTLEICLDKCSEHAVTTCGAAIFDTTGLKCYFKDTTITTPDGATPDDRYVLAIADRTQLASVSYCADSDNAKEKTAQNGLSYTVLCNQALNGHDLCSDDTPIVGGTQAASTNVWSIVRHYIRGITGQEFDNPRDNTANSTVGRANLDKAVGTDDCVDRTRSNGTILESSKVTFNLTCGNDNKGVDIMSHHATSIDTCIDSCATYANASCMGIVFDSSMNNGFENCYLKSSIGVTVPDATGFISAARQDGSNNSSAGNPTSNNPKADKPNTKHQARKAWIAGPVISGILLIAIIVGALWWFRRRRRTTKTEMKYSHVPLSQGKEYVKPELEASEAPRYELATMPRTQELGSTSPREFRRPQN